MGNFEYFHENNNGIEEEENINNKQKINIINGVIKIENNNFEQKIY